MYFFYNGDYMLVMDYYLGLDMCYIHEDELYDLWNDIIFPMLDHMEMKFMSYCHIYV